MKIQKFGTVLLTALMLWSGVAAASAQTQIDEKQFDAAMQRYLSTDKGQEAVGNAIRTYSQKLQEKALTEEFERQFANPVKMDPGNSPARGPKDAKITIVEFSDFQCPFCKRGKDTMEQLVKAYPNQIRLVFKNMPLPMHPQAMPAAKAAMAAAKQGKFWEMHDAFFDNQGKLGDEFFLAKAKEFGLNLDKFKSDMNSPEVAKQIKEDIELGQKNGIQGTPGFFVNGVAVKGAYPLEHFKKIVDRLLAGGTTKPAASAAK